jgi:capsular polysaccharide export protein
MKYILVYIGSLEDYNFFKRFHASIVNDGMKLLFLHNKISLALRCLSTGIPSVLVRRKIINSNDQIISFDLHTMRDVVAKELTLEEAQILSESVQSTFVKLLKTKNIVSVFVMNGGSIPTKSIAEICKRENKSILYFELGNIFGKMFVDIVGVNAQSSLYQSIDILFDYPVPMDKYEQWKRNYISQKLSKSTIFKSIRIPNILFVLDLIGFYFFNIPANGEKSIRKKIIYFIRSKSAQFKYDSYNIYKNKYIFLPLQLTNDTQLLLNSSINNYDAIKIAHDVALSMNVDLVVNIHPLEKDPDTLTMIDKLRKEYKFYVVDSNTMELIQKCIKVYTINSTTGLEAIICGKDVIFLGKSFYPKLKGELLKNYILSYLVNIDYYSNESIDANTLQLLFQRAGIVNQKSYS